MGKVTIRAIYIRDAPHGKGKQEEKTNRETERDARDR